MPSISPKIHCYCVYHIPSHQGVTCLISDSSSSGPWPALQTLKLSNNNLGVAGGCGLSQLLRQCSGLQELYVDACGLSWEVFGTDAAFSEALRCASLHR